MTRIVAVAVALSLAGCSFFVKPRGRDGCPGYAAATIDLGLAVAYAALAVAAFRASANEECGDDGGGCGLTGLGKAGYNLAGAGALALGTLHGVASIVGFNRRATCKAEGRRVVPLDWDAWDTGSTEPSWSPRCRELRQKASVEDNPAKRRALYERYTRACAGEPDTDQRGLSDEPEPVDAHDSGDAQFERIVEELRQEGKRPAEGDTCNLFIARWRIESDPARKSALYEELPERCKELTRPTPEPGELGGVCLTDAKCSGGLVCDPETTRCHEPSP